MTSHLARLSFITLFALAACTPAPQLEHREFMAMGTMVEVTVADTDNFVPASAITAVEREFQRLGKEWYAWNRDGELAKLNATLAAGEWFNATPELVDVLQRAAQVYGASDGAFDPAIAPMVERWGFHDGEQTPHAPSASQLQGWRAAHATFADVQIDGHRIQSKRRDAMLDLGAIGKGYAVDRAVDMLRRSGIRNALVNAGGNLRVIGQRPGYPWRIAIRHPRTKEPLARIELQGDESVATSGDYERSGELNGKRIHHLLDPRSGQPALHTQSITVFASNATLADAASTALFIAGPDRWLDMAKRLGVIGVVRIDASGRVQATRSLQPRLHVSELTVAVEWLDL
jgi:thiamine biosynthesis lipoprotein